MWAARLSAENRLSCGLENLTVTDRCRPVSNTTRGFTDDVASIDFYLTDYGIMKHRVYHDGEAGGA